MLIHIGYHKTATTWLQREIFGNTANGFTMPWTRGEVFESLIGVNSLSLDRGSVIDRYRQGRRNAETQGLTPVISHERLSGYPSSGGFDSRLLADRLAECFPDAKILMLIREQRSVLRSWYSQYVIDGGALSLPRFLSPPEPHLLRIPHFRHDFYEYDHLIRYYKKCFPAKSILVLPFELLVSDPYAFLGRLSSFVGSPSDLHPPLIRRNVGISPVQVWIVRQGNKLFARNQVNPVPIFESVVSSRVTRRFAGVASRVAPAFIQEQLAIRAHRHIDTWVGKRYKASNRQTSELIDCDLAVYGYDC